MSFDYASARATAERLIAYFGQQMTLRRKSMTGDSWNAEPGPVADFPITAVDLNRRVRDANGTLVEAAGRTLYVAAKGVVPTKADSVLIGGDWLEIAEVRPLNPGGTDVMYEVDLVR